MKDQLADVKRVGPPLSRVLVPCPACGGDGYRESGFESGSNVGIAQRCGQCFGSGRVWTEVKAAP